MSHHPNNELLTWFAENAPNLGRAYQGAILNLNEGHDAPQKVLFAAHGVREVMNKLPRIFIIEEEAKRERQIELNDFRNLCDPWVKAVSPHVGMSDAITVRPSDIDRPIEIRQKTMKQTAILFYRLRLQNEEGGFAAMAQRLFVAVRRESEEATSLLATHINDWKTLYEYFMQFAHISDVKENRILDWDEFVRKFKLFESHLLSLVGGFLANTEELDAILSDANK